jgi:hypothetical protein
VARWRPMTGPESGCFSLISGAAVAPPVRGQRAQPARGKAAPPRPLQASTVASGRKAQGGDGESDCLISGGSGAVIVFLGEFT